MTGAPKLAMMGMGPHVRHQSIIAEGRAAFGDHDLGIACAACFFYDVAHVPRGEKLALLDVQRAACCGGGEDQVGLTAEEGGDLQHVHHFGQCGALVPLMHIRQHRQAGGFPNVGENLQRRVQPHAAGGLAAGAVCLVERALEDQADAEVGGDIGQRFGAFQGVGAAFYLAGAGDEGQWHVVAEGELAQPEHGLGGGKAASAHLRLCFELDHIAVWLMGLPFSTQGDLVYAHRQWLGLCLICRACLDLLMWGMATLPNQETEPSDALGGCILMGSVDV